MITQISFTVTQSGVPTSVTLTQNDTTFSDSLTPQILTTTNLDFANFTGNILYFQMTFLIKGFTAIVTNDDGSVNTYYKCILSNASYSNASNGLPITANIIIQ